MYIDEQVQGTIYFVDGTPFSFDTNNIIDDDISILQQATADNSFGVGGTYSSTLNMTIRIPSGYTNSYDIIGSRVVLKSKYGSEENYVMRGVFWVTSASRYKDIYTITASDAITWLDIIPYLNEPYTDNNNFTYNNLVYAYMCKDINSLNGKLQDIMSAINGYLLLNNINITGISTHTNSILNDAPLESEGYPETYYVALPSESKDDNTEPVGENATQCPRDYAGWLSQIACGFLECVYLENDETPYISIGQFETFPSMELSWKDFQQDTLEIASFTINCCQVYVEIYNGTLGSTNIVNKNINSFVIDWTGNPFVDGHWAYRENSEGNHSAMDILENALNFMQKVSIRPFSAVYHGEKRFKLGQCIKIIDEDETEYLTTLTKIQWNFRGGYELKCSGEDNRVLFDSARRTPSVRAKEQALTKTNYAIKKTENGLQANIDYIDSKFETKLQDADGKTQDLNYWVDCLWESMYGGGDTVDKIRQNTNALKSAIESLGGSVNGWIDY